MKIQRQREAFAYRIEQRTAMPDYTRFIPDIHRLRDEIVAAGETNSAGGPSCGVTAEEVAEMLRGQGVAASENYGAFHHPGGGTPEHAWVNLPGGHILDPTADQFGYEPVRLLHPGHPDHVRYLNQAGDDHHTAYRTAMPVPRTVPRNRENWEKTYDKLNDKAKKNGLGVELVPNFQMDVKDFEDQAFDLQWDWRGLRGGRSSWYSTPIEYEGKGVPGIGYQRKVLNEGSEGREIPIDYLIHHGDDGRINGILSHFPEGTPFEKPGSITVTVHPAHREKGIGGKLVQEAEKRFGLKLDEQQFTPLGYEMYRRLKHERGQDVPNIFNEKIAASVADQTIKRLEKEFNEWWAGTGRDAKDIDYVRNDPDTTNGPISDWPTIEQFLKENYPAAHRDDLYMGKEHAQPLLKETLSPSGGYYGPDNSWYDFPETFDRNGPEKYETGQEAVAKHGYDPAEIIAGMLYLHNESHPYREQVLRADRKQIMDVVKARRKMQKAYEKRQKAGAIGEDLYVNGLIDRLKGEFDDWYADKFKGKQDRVGYGDRGPIGSWNNIEEFLFRKYPAANQPSFWMGAEMAGPALDGVSHRGEVYETGPEAVAKHGYDPKEIAATMLLLHSRSHPHRVNDVEWMQADVDRLYDIYRKRQQMERNRPKMQKVFDEMDAIPAFDLNNISDDDLDRLEQHDPELAGNIRKKRQPVMAAKGMGHNRLLKKLQKEFDAWAVDNAQEHEGVFGDQFNRGPIGEWWNVENFLADHYPAAHRGLDYGWEEAGSLLDSDADDDNSVWLFNHPEPFSPYETGPHAVAQHGYDPKEVAAAMLLLHNRSHPNRSDLEQGDTDRLAEIARIRTKMEKARVATTLTADDVIDRIGGEFYEWAKDNGKTNPYDERRRESGDTNPKFMRGAIGYWPHIESFLKERYPAAHRGLTYGFEDAMPLLDNEREREPLSWLDGKEDYETGHEAEQKYGYDPKEVVSALLLLHNETHHGRDNYLRRDMNRLLDIAMKRHKMQKAYEKAQAKYDQDWKVASNPTKLSGELLAQLEREFDHWVSNQSEHHHITNWPSIEGFLLDNYPAAHRGFDMGLEEARPLLRGEPNTLATDYPGFWENWADKKDYDTFDPYETGPEAVAKYGYDPHHVAAGMVYLHNKANGVIQDRDKEIAEDVDFLHGLFKIRTKMQRNHEKRQKQLVNAARKIAFNQDLVDRLNDEFHSWYDKDGLNALAGNDPNMDYVHNNNKGNPLIKEVMRMFVEEGRKAEVDGRGPIGYWPNIENFLKAKYPAAHKNFGAGMEQAGPHIDNFDETGLGAPYETGPEAVAQHGYDPAEVAAAFVLLHNKSHPLRGRLEATDRDRLLKIFKVRERMQRQYEDRLNKELVTASIDYDDTPYWADAWDDEDDDDELPRHKRAAFDRMWYNIFLRRLAAGEEQAWKEEINRLAQQGIPIDLIKKLHENWVLTKKPINPDTGQPHTPQSARSSWVSGWVPFLEQYFPDSSTQRHMFDAVQGHNRAVDDVIRDLISDNGNPDRLTAGAMALHSMENGNFGLYQKILRMDPDLKRRTQEIADARSKGYHVDISTGLMTKPAPPTDFRKNIPPNLRSQPGEPTWMKNRKKQQQQQLPADTTPKPQGIPV